MFSCQRPLAGSEERAGDQITRDYDGISLLHDLAPAYLRGISLLHDSILAFLGAIGGYTIQTMHF